MKTKRGRLDSGFQARLDAWRAAGPGQARLQRLLVVAGPYGSGKSTLLEQLAAGRLPPEIGEAAPAGAGGWMQTSGRKVYSARDDEAGAADDGLTLHYNLLRPQVWGIASYAADPALQVIDLAGEVTVLTLRPPLPWLVEQFVRRSLVEQSEASALTRLRRMIVAKVSRSPPAVSPAVAPEPAAAAGLHGRYRRVYRLYQQPGWLDCRYRRWEEFLASRLAAGRIMRSLWVEPATTRADAPSFRLTEPPSLQS